MAKKQIEEVKKTSYFTKTSDPDLQGIDSFKVLTKKAEELYGSETGLAKSKSHRQTNRRIFSIKSKSELATEIQNNLDNPGKLAESSKILHSIDPNYQKVISYYSDMFLNRYTVTPVALSPEALAIQKEEYLVMYNEMMEVVDGLSLEVLVPTILQEVFLTGAANITAQKNNSAKTIGLILLPAEYCRTTFKTNYGTNIIEFNFKYFDAFGEGDPREHTLDIFPKEFRKLYSEYLNDKIEWKQLDPRTSTSITKNDKGIPPFLNALDGINEYEAVRTNELAKGENQLKAIFVNQIPIENGEPIFDIDEVTAIQRKIANITRQHEGLDTITVFGDSELIRLQDEGKTENKRIQQAFRTIYNAAGMNANIFDGTIAEALKINLKADKAMVWQVIKIIENYLNLVVNNSFKFRTHQAEITFLPITIYDEAEKTKEYLEYAKFGIGKIDAIVASGTKQKHILHKKQLELALDLDNILTPLKSTHTTPGDAVPQKETPETQDNPEEVEEDN